MNRHTEVQQIRLRLIVTSLINLFICGTWIGYLVMIVIMIAVPMEETTSRITQVIFLRKTSAQHNQKVGAIFFFVEEGIWKCGVCMVLNHNEVKLDVSVSADGSEALSYSRIGAGVFKLGGLRLLGHPDGSSVSTILKIYSLKRERKHERLFFEGWFNFVASEVKKKFYGT